MTIQTAAQIAEQVLATIGTDLKVDTMVAEAREKLTLPPAGKREAGVANLIGEQAIVAQELIARADQLAEIAKAATEEREQIKNTLRDVLGKREVLKVNGAEVFTNKPVESRVLDQAAVKAKFPDIPGNEWAYVTRTTRSARFK